MSRPVGWRRTIGDRHPRPFTAKEGQRLTDDGAARGLPLGGLGTGSIGRDHDGHFTRWHLNPGDYGTRYSSGSWLGVQRLDVPSRPVALVPAGCATRPAGLAPSPGPVGEYEALFPFAWYRYDPRLADGVRIEVRQWSPVAPGLEEESGWPVAFFEVTATSELEHACELALTLAFELPLDQPALAGDAVELCSEAGVAAALVPDAGASVALAVDEGEGGTAAAWGLDGDSAFGRLAGGLWSGAAPAGASRVRGDAAPGPGGPRGGTGPGLAASARVRIEPGASAQVAFALAWDVPLVRFGERRQHAWYRSHVRRFGTTGTAAQRIATTALSRRGELAASVEAWHAELGGRLEGWGAPSWLAPALCNELYQLVEGGTAWVVGPEGGPAEEHFATFESIDYRFFETLDVRYYSSFALLELWPRLERLVIRDFLASVAVDDPTPVCLEWENRYAPRKRRGAAPHDLGGLLDDPFRLYNGYTYRDSGPWKDLNSKLVLQVARDALLLDDRGLPAEAWPACLEAIRYLEAQDMNGDGLPDHDGTAAQTFDNWPMRGVSAYCGDLWVACLAAARGVAVEAGDQVEADRLEALRQRASECLEAALWTGTHYRFDSDGGPESMAIMADQLPGSWYALLLGLPLPHGRERIERTLTTVLERNFRCFADGRLGPVNGRGPDGGPPPGGGEQADEVWSGVGWSLASLALLLGRDADAWEVGEALYRTVYEEGGLWFRTPEAWTEDRRFRAAIYNRPLAVWSLYTALRLR